MSSGPSAGLPIAPTLCGLNLWLVGLVVPLSLALAAGQPLSGAWVPLSMTPLSPVALGLGLWLRSRRLGQALLLLAVPLFALAPSGDVALSSPRLWPRPAVLIELVLLLAYLVLTCKLLARQTSPLAPAVVTTEPPRAWQHEPVAQLNQLPPPSPRLRRRLQMGRLLCLYAVAVPAVVVYALDFHTPHLRVLQKSFPNPLRQSAIQATATALISPLAVLDDGAMDGPGESRDALIDGAMALHTVPATADEPSGSMITVPWPTVGGAGEYDLDEDTLTWRSRERGRSTSRAAMGRPPATRIAPSPSSTPTLPKPKLDTDSDPEAVTKPAERASPEEALAPSLPPFDGMAAPPVLPPALTTGRRQKAVRRPRGRWGGLALTDRGSLLLWILVIGATVWLVLKWRTNHLGF